MSHIFGVHCITNREALIVGDSKMAFLELGFVDMVATHAYDHLLSTKRFQNFGSF
jgi:hypothetical protein